MRRFRFLRRRLFAFAMLSGIVGQATCAITPEQLVDQTAGVVTRTAATFLADAVFFFLDNLLVRLTAG